MRKTDPRLPHISPYINGVDNSRFDNAGNPDSRAIKLLALYANAQTIRGRYRYAVARAVESNSQVFGGKGVGLGTYEPRFRALAAGGPCRRVL